MTIANILLVMMVLNGHMQIVGQYKTEEACLKVRAEIQAKVKRPVGCLRLDADYGGRHD